MKADGQVAQAFVQEPFQSGKDAYRRKSDPVGAPCESPGSSHDIQEPEDIPGVVQRFAHAHHYYVAQYSSLGQAVELVQYFMLLQMVVESLAAGGAKSAVHPASGLGGYAKRGPVMFRDIDRFYECLRFCAFFRWNRAGKEVFLRTVL